MMGDPSSPILELFKVVAELFNKIKNETIIAVVGIAILVVAAIVILPAGTSTDRYVIAIVALVLIFGALLFVLLKLANDRNNFARAEAKWKIEKKQLETQGKQTLKGERALARRLLEKYASETANAMITFGVNMLESDIPEKQRDYVLVYLIDYLEYLSGKQREWQREDISDWFASVGKIIQKEQDISGYKEVRMLPGQ
jgi:hypothetical protein